MLTELIEYQQMQSEEKKGNPISVQQSPIVDQNNRLSQPSLFLHSDDDQDSDNDQQQHLKRHERTNFAMTTGAKAKHQNHLMNKSRSSSSSSNFGATNLIPQPLPIFDGRAQNEPNLHAGFRRIALVKQAQADDVSCQHSNQNNIENWFCKDCNQQLPQFDCIFDDNQGRVNTFLKICYENQFLQDFQSEYLDLIAQSPKTPLHHTNPMSAGAVQQAQQQKPQQQPTRPPEIIFQQYQPSNVSQLREYMLYCVSRDQQQIFANSQALPNGQEPTVTVEGQQELPRGEPASSQQQLEYAQQQVEQMFRTGQMSNLSGKLTKYLLEMQENQNQLLRKYQGNILQIDSIFESGNLLQAERAETGEYRIFMQVDTNTKGHQQWFNFRVRNTRKGRKYNFQIMNFTKPGVTGGTGYKKNELKQRIVFKSNLAGHQEWQSIGQNNLEFVKTKVQRRKKDVLAAGADSDQDEEVEEFFGNENETHAGTGNEGPDFVRSATLGMNGPNPQTALKKKKVFYYYSLNFDHEFEHDYDTVYFAFSQPFTFSQIVRDVLTIEQQIQPTDKSLIKHIRTQQLETETTIKPPEPMKKAKQLGTIIVNQPTTETIQAQKLPMAGIQFENKQQLIYYRREEMCRSVCGLPIWQITVSREAKPPRKKPVILITSRVHSGETPASMVFKGMLEFLVSDKKEAKFLRRFYTFILVPCLNPDGVVCGNYRNSVSGVDLNRQWINPDEEFQPEIFYTKSLLKRLTEVEKRHIWIYCDLHGHSKKTNSFFYGCNTAANGGFLSWTIVRLLPRIFAQKTHMFNFKDCRFKVEPYKIGTGRVVAWKQFQITHSFTLENSFYGYDFGDDETREFSEEDYHTVGSKFCDSVYEFHYVWKQIQRELNVTNGWLKPRVLIEKTGVPAAQILQEELAKKKKEEQKLIAIEQYQQFLKKFNYGAKGKPSKILGQKVVTGITLETEHLENNQQWVRQSTNFQQSTNQTHQTEDKGQEIIRYLENLVKLQAHIRGFIIRKKFESKLRELKRKRLEQKRQETRLLPVLSETKIPTVDNLMNESQTQTIKDQVKLKIPTGVLINPPESLDSMSQSGFGKISTRRVELMSRDWRTYFQQEELETAFQVVEIEQRDIPEENSSDDGSASNPSDDNLEPDERYENVYCLPEDKTKKILQETQNQKLTLMSQIRKGSPITAAQLYNKLKNQGASNTTSGSGANAVRNQQNKLGRLQSGLNISGYNNSGNAQIQQQENSLRGGKGNLNNISSQNQLQMKVGQSPYQNNFQILSKSQALNGNNGSDSEGNSEMQRLQNSYNQARIDSLLQKEYNSQNQKYTILQQGRALQSALQMQRGQLRATTAHGSDSYLGGPIASSIMPNTGLANSRPRENNGQFKYYRLNQNGKYSKRENISQVIKDCFITKQVGVPRPVTKQASRTTPMIQKGSAGNYPPFQEHYVEPNFKNSRQVTKQKLQFTDKKSSSIQQNHTLYQEQAKGTFSLINYDAQMFKKAKRQVILSEERRSLSPKTITQVYQNTQPNIRTAGSSQIQHRDQVIASNQNLRTDPSRPKTTYQAQGFHPMGGIRVVKQPNSNLTYLQVYPKPSGKQNDYI